MASMYIEWEDKGRLMKFGGFTVSILVLAVKAIHEAWNSYAPDVIKSLKCHTACVSYFNYARLLPTVHVMSNSCLGIVIINKYNCHCLCFPHSES